MFFLKKVVFPGDFLSKEEEYSLGKNVFVDRKGNICSATVGKAEFNNEFKRVNVEKENKRIELVSKNSIVFGRVKRVKDNFVVIELLKAEENGKKATYLNSTAVIPISSAERGFVKDLSEKFKIGDIVKAKVKEVGLRGIELITEFPELGVIKAFCVKCRKPLHLFGGNLKCLNCGNTETRKLSNDYWLK